MKKFIFIILTGLLISSSVFSQNLERGMWQLQNPGQIYMNSLVTFKRGVFNNSMMNMTDNVSRQAIGSYQVSGSTMIMVVNNQRYVYTLKWFNQNKFTLSTSQGSLIYVQSNTAEDKYFQNYMNWYGMNGGGLKPSPGGGGSNQRELCYTCKGVGSCKVCGGTGSYSGYGGESHLCTACKHTGKCWHCQGSGYQ